MSWKVYNDPTGLLELSPLPYFKTYTDPLSLTGLELIARGLTPDLPGRLRRRRGSRHAALGVVDHAAAGRVRAPGRAARVRRVPGAADPEHAGLQPRRVGQDGVHRRLRRERRLLRPRAAADPAGRHRRRVPDRRSAALGGRRRRRARSASGSAPRAWSSRRSAPAATCTPETFDHTSMLRLIETRFGVEVPNLSAWRRSVTGDLTGALRYPATPVTTVPTLPRPRIGSDTTRGRGGGAQRARRHAGRRHRLPAADHQLDAVAGDDTGAPEVP